MDSKIKWSAAGALFIALLAAEYSILAYYGNPMVPVAYFVSIVELAVFTILLAHVSAMTIWGLRVGEQYFILPHPGIYALKDGGPKRIFFRDVEVAYYHQSRAGGGSQLRIKLSDGEAISIRRGDLGVNAGNFDAMIRQMDALKKLDAGQFNS